MNSNIREAKLRHAELTEKENRNTITNDEFLERLILERDYFDVFDSLYCDDQQSDAEVVSDYQSILTWNKIASDLRMYSKIIPLPDNNKTNRDHLTKWFFVITWPNFKRWVRKF